MVRAVVDEDGEEGGKGVEGKEEATESEDDGGKKPGCCVAGGQVEGAAGVDGREELLDVHDQVMVLGNHTMMKRSNSNMHRR